METQKQNEQIANASFNLLRRLPPKNVPKNLACICQLIEDEEMQNYI